MRNMLIASCAPDKMQLDGDVSENCLLMALSTNKESTSTLREGRCVESLQGRSSAATNKETVEQALRLINRQPSAEELEIQENGYRKVCVLRRRNRSLFCALCEDRLLSGRRGCWIRRQPPPRPRRKEIRPAYVEQSPQSNSAYPSLPSPRLPPSMPCFQRERR